MICRPTHAPALLLALLVGWQTAERRSTGSTTPGVRNAHGLAFDAQRSRVVLFGGADVSAVRSDTWEYDGRGWRPVAHAGPGPRTFPAMTYDAARRRTLLFGGNRVLFGTEADTATFLADTWTWDGAAWTRHDVAGPPPRAEAVLAFDHRRGRAVLFGGYHRVAGEMVRLGDTWEWGGARWEQAATAGPAPRNGASLAFDPGRGRVLLFGGRTPDGIVGETWEWDGRRWLPIETPPTPARFNAAMSAGGEDWPILRFGGWERTGRVADTWAWTGNEWRRLDVTGPEARNHSAMVYDPAGRRVVLYGGHDGTNVFGDTWEWDGERWRRGPGTDPLARIENGH